MQHARAAAGASSTSWSCRTSSSPGRPRSPTSCCPSARVVVRGRGHRHQLRAARAARAQGARAAGRGARRHVDPQPSSPGGWATTGATRRRGGLGRAALAVADARRHALRPARGARRHPVAVPRRGRIPGSQFLHERLWAGAARGPAGAVLVVEHRPPFEALDAEYPLRLTTGRRLESYNTGAQTEPLQLAAAPRRVARPVARGRRAAAGRGGRDRARLVAPRRGRGARAHRPVAAAGAGFMTFHFPDQVDSNVLTIDATDPKSRHRRVQGGGDPGGQDHRRRSAAESADGRAARRGHGTTDGHPSRLDAEPTDDERAAVDRLLGPPSAAGTGGVRAAASRRRARPPRGGHAARSRRHELLPALWAVQEHIGWISPGALNYVCERLDRAARRRVRRGDLLRAARVEPRPPRVIHVCEDLACNCVGSDDLIAQLEERFGPEGDLSDDGSATWYRSPCLGQCDRAPAALVTVAGEEPERARAGAGHGAATCCAALARRRRAGRSRHGAAADRRLAAAAARASAASTRSASTTTAPPAATRRCARASSSAPTA